MQVRWSASTVRSSSAHVVCVTSSSAVPSRCRITTGSSPVADLDRQLDVAEHPVGVGVGDEHRPSVAGGSRDELVTVDQSHPGLDRVDARAGEGDVEERHRREHAALDALVVAQALHRAFEHERRAGHGVQDVAVLGGRGDESLGDLGVDVGERVGRLVDRRRTKSPPARALPTGAAWCAGSDAGARAIASTVCWVTYSGAAPGRGRRS